MRQYYIHDLNSNYELITVKMQSRDGLGMNPGRETILIVPYGTNGILLEGRVRVPVIQGET
jgi:hypothetical protein